MNVDDRDLLRHAAEALDRHNNGSLAKRIRNVLDRHEAYQPGCRGCASEQAT